MSGQIDAATADADTPWARFLRSTVDRPGWTVARLSRETAGSDGKPRVSKATIFRMLNGSTKKISTSSVRILAEAAGVEIDTALRAASSQLVRDDEAPEDWPYGLDPKDPIVQAILSGPFDDDMQDRMLRYEVTRRQQRLEEIEITAQAYRRNPDEDTSGGMDKAA